MKTGEEVAPVEQEAIQNPADRLIVEGFAAFDPALEGLAVFVTNTTTKLLQQQKRQPA